MRSYLILLVMLMLCGCFGKRKSGQEAAGSFSSESAFVSGGTNGKQKVLVTSENSLVGKVVMVNTTGRFLVLSFPVGHLPKLEQHLNLYRGGNKVGEVKITGPQYDDNIVGDLLAGESEVGDAARDR